MASLDKLFRIQMGKNDTLSNVAVSTDTIGTMYVTTDTGVIYLDIPNGDSAARIGLNALKAAEAVHAASADSATKATSADSAKKWTSAINITTTDGTHTSESVVMDGSDDVTIKLPTTISAAATSAGKWTSDGKVILASSDGSNATSAQTLNYSASGITLKLPSTIKANIIGNITGNVTGNVTGTAGSWASAATLGTGEGPVTVTPSVTSLNAGSEVKWNTSIANGQITNAMLAGSIANAKLANSQVTIAGNAVALGGSLAADTLRSSLGLASALRFVGTIEKMTDITVADPGIGSGYAPTVGDVVLTENGQEYVYANSQWNLLGDNAQSFKVVQSAVANPIASGTATAFIDTIEQNTNGVITVTKKSLPTATASVLGIASFNSTYFSVSSGAVSLKSLGSLNATTATAWKSAVTVQVTDSTGTNKGASATLSGTEGTLSLKMPASFNATVSNAEVAAKTAGTLSINGKTFNGLEDVTVGTLGIAFGGTGRTDGKAVAWASSIEVTTTDGTNTSAAVTMDGSKAVAINLPANIKATTFTGSLNGNASSATKLATGRTLKVSLGSTAASTAFNGTANITDIGVSGTLGTANGGTGRTNGTIAKADAWTSAINLKVGETSKTVDGSIDITFAADEIGSTVVWGTWD